MKKMIIFLIAVLSSYYSFASVYAAQVPSGKRPSIRESAKVKEALQNGPKKTFNLFHALKTNDKITLDTLKKLEEKYLILYTDRDPDTGATPLMIVVQENKFDLAKYIVDVKKVYLNEQDTNGNTALHYSLMLLDSLPPQSPQHLSALEMTRYLISKFTQSPLGTAQKNKSGQTALDIAMQMHNKELMTLLTLHELTNLKTDKDKKETPLMQATDNNRLDIVKYLVEEKKRDLNEQDSEGNTALHHSIRMIKGLADLLQDTNLIKSIDVNNYHNAVAIAHYLITKFAKLPNGTGQRNKSGLTALNIALQIPDQKIMHELARKLIVTMKPHTLDAHDPNSTEAPLHLAIKNGDVELVDLLLKAGADHTLSRTTNQTPLIFARAIKKRLINEDADKLTIENYDKIIKLLQKISNAAKQ